MPALLTKREELALRNAISGAWESELHIKEPSGGLFVGAKTVTSLLEKGFLERKSRPSDPSDILYRITKAGNAALDAHDRNRRPWLYLQS